MKRYFSLIIVLSIPFFFSACATKKSRNDVSGFKKFYHNTTAKFNGYFNANVLLEESIYKLEEMHEDNYNQVLDVYKYSAVDNAESVSADLDKAIEKVSVVATLHDVSNWVDDCYVLMGKAQYLKQDYESAEETFEYFVEEFDPKNSFLRKREKSRQEVKKEKEKERKEERKLKEEERKEKEEQKEEERKEKEKTKKQKEKERKAAAKAKKKERDRKKKEREKQIKQNRKNKNKDRSKRDTKKEEVVVKPEPKKEETKESGSEPKVAEKNNTTPKTTPQPEKKEVKEEVNEEESSSKKAVEPVNESANEGGLFKRKPAYQDGILWLAKTYIERERWSVASYMLNKLEGMELIDDIAEQLPAAWAYFYMEQKAYDQAIPHLQKAIEVTKNKKQRARYAYILGQVQQIQGNGKAAYANFEQVIKWKPGYEMEFNARLNMAKNSWATGNESSESVLKKLDKMLNEDKNRDYKGEIYYTIADIHLQQNNKAEAIESLEKSIQFNTTNSAQKTESYYTLAKLYYGNEEYVKSKFYFDSTLTVMKEMDLRFEETKNFSENLQDIAANIQIIETQDSLLRISLMSDDEKKALAQKIKDERTQNDKSQNEEDNLGIPGRMSTTRVAGSKPSNFFAYNEISLRKGAQDFQTKWGDIRLEDDWRRSNKSSSSEIDEEIEDEIEESYDITAAEMKSILKGVPNNPSEVARANEMIKNAMFDLGVLYRDRLKNFNKSVNILEEMLLRFPNSDKELEGMYYLYLGYLDLNNTSKANYYKEQITTKFPGSIYAQSLSDPNFAKKFMNEKRKLEAHYDLCYEMFDAGEFEKSYEKLMKTEELFGTENSMKAKFALLTAMCVGNLEGKDAYVDALKNVIARHPNTPEQTRAKEIMRFLRGDKQAFDKVDESKAQSEFTIQDDKLHYVIAVIYSSEESLINSSKISISNFNKNHFKDKRLKISGIPLSNADESNIILIRKFTNREDAMTYYQQVEEKSDEFLTSDVEFEVFAITQKNYREVIKKRSVNSYRVFFQGHYIK